MSRPRRDSLPTHRFSPIPALVALALAACADGVPRGTVVASLSSDMVVPKDLDRVTVTIWRGDGAPTTRAFPEDDGPLRMPITLTAAKNAPAGENVRIVVAGFRQDELRVVAEARVSVPNARRVAVPLTLGWLCVGMVNEDANRPRGSCAEGETCVEGRCANAVIEADELQTFNAAPDRVGADDCFDVFGCFQRAPAVELDRETCSLRRPDIRVGLNVALELESGGDGACDSARCLIPLDAFAPRGGWTERDDRVALPQAVCDRLDRDVRAVRLADECVTKTVSVPACLTAAAAPLDAGAGDDGGAGGAGGGTDADAGLVSICDTATLCMDGDGCCPGQCNGKTDGDCEAVCGNDIVEPGEICDGDCPTTCVPSGCTRRMLIEPGTCDARCVDDDPISMCVADDGCCATGCSPQTDSDCMCVPRDETCNGKDDDCDGVPDNGVLSTYYRDRDGDGVGDEDASTAACAPPKGYVVNSGDCDDANGSIRPGRAEDCNALDDNCDGKIDEGCAVTKSFTYDDFAPLSAQHPSCTSPTSPCMAASARRCREESPTLIGGFGVTAVDDTGAAHITCVTFANASYVIGKFQPTLSTHNALCTFDGRAPSPVCTTAVHQYCQDNGFTSGFGPIEYLGNDAHFVCVKRSTLVTLPLAELTALQSACNDLQATTTLPCRIAYHAHCTGEGFVSGYGPVALTQEPPTVTFSCLPRE